MAPRFILNRITATMLMSVGALPAWAVDANNITVHDGKFNGGLTTGLTTDTHIAVNGTVTDITTGTQRGSTAFNSFGNFSVGAGNTVNLVVPDAASNLVNLVHNSQAVVNGTLNGIKGGKIGGNIIFADAQGMVVGASGVVNVGSLTITAPTAAQMQQLAAEAHNGSATSSDQAAADLIAGKYTGGSGSLSISGSVNASGSVNLFAASATLAQASKVNAGADFADAVFRSTVNVSDAQGTGVARQNGSIQIVADKTVAASGELKALMADNSGGNVQVSAGQSVAFNDGAKVTATGAANKAGGKVTVTAPSIRLNGNVTVDTSSSGTGQAGDITLTANSDASISGATATSVDQLAQQLEDQAQPLLASNVGKAEVVVGAGARLIAGQTTDASKRGTVSLSAFGFDKQLSGYADASGTVEVAGQITAKDILLHANAEAMISNTLLGSLFSSGALKDDFSKLKTLNNWSDDETWANIISTLGDAGSQSARASNLGTLGLDPTNWSELAALLPNITVAIANANAAVKVDSTAVLNAAGNIDVAAKGTRTVDTSTGTLPGLSGKLPFNLGVAYGRVSGTTSVDVASGAQLTTAADLSLQALSSDVLKLEASSTNSKDGNGSQSNTAGFAFGMAHSDVDTTVNVAHGALLNVTRDTAVSAVTEQTLSNNVTFKSLGQGAAGGPAIALTLFDSTTRATFDADMPSGRNLSVTAVNLIQQQQNSATVQAGNSDKTFQTAKTVATTKPITDLIGAKVKALFGISPDGDATKKTDATFRFGSAVAIGIANHTAEAILGSSGAPTLSLSGDLSVQALQSESDLHNSANSSVYSKADLGDSAESSLSVAAAYNQLTLTTHALIGDGVTVTAARLGVGAYNQQLLNLAGIDRWSSLSDIYTTLKTQGSGLADLPNTLSTNYANGTANGTDDVIVGAVGVMVNSLDATAWVGDNVHLTTTGTSAAPWSTSPLAGLATAYNTDGTETDASKAAHALSFDWDSPLTVQARTDVQQLQIAGNFWSSLFNTASGDDGTSAGGALNVQVTGNSTIAGIGAGGHITAAKGAVNVGAEQNELIIGISPSGGKGPSAAGNGAIVVSVNNATVTGSINNSTAVTADAVDVTAAHHVGMWSAAGAIALSQNGGVGASAAVNVLTSDVEALVGANQGWRPSSALGGAGSGLATPATWSADKVVVNATSDGQAGAFGLSGARAKSEQEQQAQDKAEKTDGGAGNTATTMADSLGDAMSQTLANAIADMSSKATFVQNKLTAVKDAVVGLPDEISSAFDKFKAAIKGTSPDQGTQEGSTFAVAGSVGLNVSRQTTRSKLGDIVLDPRDPNGTGSDVTVQALNQTNQIAGAGGGALTSAGGKKSESSTAMAGAVAYDYLGNTTEALLQNATLRNNHALAVNAITAGDQVALGLGLAVATGGVQNTAGALIASAASVTNSTRAVVTDSSVSQKGSGSIDVTAYDRSRLLIGGGAFAGSNGEGNSMGLSLTVGVLANKIQAQWLGSTATGFGSFDLAAFSATRVLAGVLSVAASSGQESTAGAGALFALVLTNEINANVDKDSAGNGSSLTGGAVNVTAASASNDAALDALISAAGSHTLANSGLDMDGSSTAAGIDGTTSSDNSLTGGSSGSTTERDLYTGGTAGEAILGIAGGIAGTAGKSAAGGSLGVIYTGSNYTASVANTTVTLTGDLAIKALNDTQVLAAAVGAAGGTGTSISGSSAVVVGRGNVTASLDMAGRTLTADDLTVTAKKTAGAYSLAGNITASTEGGVGGVAVALTDMQQGASASISHGTYRLTGDATVGAAGQSQIVTGAISIAATGGGNAVGGAFTFNRISDTTQALLDTVDLQAVNLAVSASQPNTGARIDSLALNVAGAGGNVGAGAALAVNLIDATRSAMLKGSTVKLSGDATLSSSLDGEIWGMGVSGAGGSEAGIGASVVVNNISGGDTVGVDGGSLQTTGTDKTLSIDASGGNGLTIGSLAGAISGSGGTAVGGAISVNRIGANRTASLTNSAVSGFASNTLKSGATQHIYAAAVAGSGGDVAIGGSSTSNILSGTEKAYISGGSLSGGSLSLSSAEGDRTIWSLAGSISGAASVAVGVANANNVITASRQASISSANLTLSQALNVKSGGSSSIRSAAVGAGGSGNAAVGASIAVNVISGTENAGLDGVTLQGASAVNVDVSRGTADIKTLAGNVQGAGTGAGAGAVAVSTVDQQRNATVNNSSLSLGTGNSGIVVNALTGATIQTLALSGAGAGTGAAVFSNTSNNIAAVTHADVTGSSGSASLLNVTAKDGSSIDSLAGGAVGAGTAAVGVATAVNRIANDIKAHVGGTRTDGTVNTGTWSVNDANVTANSDATINTASISASFSGTAAVSAGIATNLLSTSSKALIDGGARLVAQNNVGVIAADRDVIRSAASVVSGSGNAAVSGLVTVNLIQSSTEAGIKDAATQVTALGNGTGLSVDNGQLLNAPDPDDWATADQFNPVANLQTASETVHGLAVRATSLQQLGQVGLSLGVSLIPLTSASVTGLTNTSVIAGDTTASIDNASINTRNTGANAAQQVSVGAASHSFSFGAVSSDSLSLGAAAVAASIDTGVVSRDVIARISHATVNSVADTGVRATSTQAASDIVATAAGGIVGVAGGAAALVLKGSTQALVTNASTLNVGSLDVNAKAVNRLSPNVGSLSGGAVGVGAGIDVGYNQSTVRAWVGETDQTSSVRTAVNTAGAVNITADSATTLFANAISASGGGVAVAGASNILLVENVTEAGARNADFGSSSQRLSSLNINATDTLNALLNVGTVGGGGVSVGGSVNVLVTNNATRAQLLNSSAWLGGPLTVNAQRTVDANLNTVTGGASANASIGGALGLLLLGSGSVAADGHDAMGELNKNGNGTLAMADKVGSRSNASTAYQSTTTDTDGKVTLVNATASGATLDAQTQTGSLDGRFVAPAASTDPTYKQETVARLSGSTVNSTGAVTVTAADLLKASNIAGGAQLSGALSLGASAAFTFSNAHVFADVIGGSLTAASLSLNGSSAARTAGQTAVTVNAYNGAAGMGAGLGAALAIAVMNNSVASNLGGTVNLSGALTSTLSDSLGVSADGIGAAVGAVGAGIVVATAERNSNVNILVKDNASLTAQSINLSSSDTGSSSATGTGAAGGLFGAGNAVASVAGDSTTVTSTSGNGVTFNAAGGVTLSASALPSVSSSATGVAVGMVGIGASVATANGNTTVTAALGDDNTLLGSGGLTLAADLQKRADVQIPGGVDPSSANVVAKAIAGSGGLYFSANGAVATATNTAHVHATTGSNLALSGGRIDISADSATHQYADALGIAVGGALAVGAAVASATADTDTQASLGSNTHASSGVTVNDVVLSATGDDLNQAQSVAGSGGLIAGNASQALTRASGNAKTSVGSGTTLTMDNLSLNASYTGMFGAHADSVNAALVGASGAGVENTLTGNSTVSVADTARLTTRQDLLMAASNHFYSKPFTSNAVSGAGGGVISGQAVINKTTITGNALVDIGDADLVAGIAPTGSIAGKLMARAYTQQDTSEDATLSTGGAIAGGGADNTHNSTLNNTVKVASGADLASYGELGLGTYTLGTAQVQALVSTWGVAGVGVANATVNLTSNQSVQVASNATIEALGNIALEAGQDPEALWQTRLYTNVNAQSVVRGLIAIPSASADSHIANNTSVSVGSGAQVLAARNITVGGFNGYNDALADGVGRGYELGFIPVTNKDSSATATRDNHVTLDGTLLAGRYNELVLTIDANGNLTQSSGLPVVAMYDAGFVPTAYLDAIAGIDPTTKQILRSTLSSSATGAWRLGPMMAAGGNVTVQADRIDGNGSVTANGGPKIQVTNNSSRYLLVGEAVIPDDTGGNVFFTGGASATQFGASNVHQVNTNVRAQMLIQNNWASSSGNVSYGPAIFLTGNLYNLSGLIHITNAKGSLGQFASTYGQQVLVEVPEGSMSVYQPNAYWPVGSNPISEWSSFADINWSANTAIELVANAVYGSGALANSNNGLLYQSGSVSTVLFGGCLPASVSSGTYCNTGTANSYTGSSTEFHGIDNASSHIPVIPILTLQKTATSYASASLSGSAASQQIVGGQVGIQARYIDINGTISSGQATTRTLSIGTNLNTWLSQHYCASHTCTSLVDIPDSYLSSTGGTLIHAKYDFVNQRIVLDDVNASGGGFVYMKGGVISTNQLGNIQVNNGYGQVTVNNLSNAQLQLGNIDTGSGSIGIVQIVDTLKAQVGNQYATTWYVDTQGQGLSIYDNRNGATSLDNAWLVSSSAANSAQYNPLTGIRYQWSQTASLHRSVYYDGNAFNASDWAWSNPANPWVVNDGYVTYNNANTNVYQRDITGSFNNVSAMDIAYHGCHGGMGSNCNWDFTANTQESSGSWAAVWEYRFPQNASITVTQSVKADNPFNIAFVGNATGAITANSNANLIVAGKLSNPVGTTTLTTNGNLTSLSGSSNYAHDLVLTAAGSIGSAGSAFAASLASGGTLTATSGSAGTYLDLGSSALIKSIKAGNGSGDVVVDAVGDLLAASGASNRSADVLGRNVTLNSSTGSLGASGNYLRLNAVEVGTSGGGTAYGVVNATANRDVYLEETTGDMWVGQIGSTTGDVSVKVDGGSLYDVGRRSSQSSDDSAQQAIWQKLALTAGYGAADNITATSVKPFQDQVNANYREYWGLLDNGSVSNGTLTLSSAGLDLYRPLAALKLGALTASDAQVNAYVNQRYTALASAFDTQIGSDWKSQAAFQAYNAQFSYVATTAQVASLSQDAVWTEGELLYAIDKAALGAASGSSVGSSQPNISGRNVNLQVAGSLGQLAGALTIDFNALRNGTLSTTEAAALAVATAPGDVKVNRDANGNILTLTVNRTLPFYVNASGQFDLNAGGSAYLQSQPDLSVGNVTVGGDARLAANGSILASATGSGTFRIGGDLTLQSTNGSLGTAGATPVALNLNVGGALLAASAGQDVAINWLNGTFNVKQIYALGGVYLNAGSGSLLQQGGDTTISGRDVTLTARDAIGSAAQAMQVELQSASAGSLSGSAGDGIWIGTDKALTVGTLQAAKGLSLTSTATAGLTATTLKALDGDLLLNTRGATRVGTAQASGQVVVASLGDVAVGQRLQAGGLVAVNGSGQLGLDSGAQLKGASLQLHANSLDLGSNASLVGGLVQLVMAGTANFGAGSHVDASGQLTLGNLAGVASGNLTLGAGAALKAASMLLDTAAVQLGSNALLSSTATLGLSASSLTMGSQAALRSGDTLSLSTTGDMVLGSLNSSGTGAQLFNIDAGGRITANGDHAANLNATGTGASTLHAGSGIGSATQALWVNLPVLTSVSTEQGDLYLRVAQAMRGTTLDARHGVLDVSAAGAGLSYDSVHAQGNLSQHGGNLLATNLTSDSGNLLLDQLGSVNVVNGSVAGTAQLTATDVTLGTLHSGGDFTATASNTFTATTLSTDGALALTTLNATLGTVSSVGAATLTLGQDLLSLGHLTTTQGNWTLAARNANVTRADIGGATQQTLTGDLVMGNLQGAGNWTLQGVNANVSTAGIGGVTQQTLTGDLVMGNLQGTGNWTLQGVNANVTTAGIGGVTQQTLTGDLVMGNLQGAGNWTLQGVNANVTTAGIGGVTQQTLSGNLTEGSLSSHGTVTANVGGNLSATTLATDAALNLVANNATLGTATVFGNAVMTLGNDLLNLGQLTTTQGDWTLGARHATVGTAVIGGDTVHTLRGNLALTSLQGTGNWHLTGVNAVIGSASLGSTADLTLSNDLQISNSLTALTTHLDLGSGSAINALHVTGDLDTQVTGGLDLTHADVTGNAVLNHRGVAGTALHYGDLLIGDTLNVTGAGNWSGTTADVLNTATYDVGSAQLGSLISRQGRLALQANGLFAANTLTSTLQDVDLVSGSANLGVVNAATTITALTHGNLIINQGFAQGDISLHTVAGSLGDIRIGDYFADPTSGFSLAKTYIQSHNDIDILTDGDVYGGSAVADQHLKMVGRNLYFGRAQSLLEDVFLQATGPQSANMGNITGLVVDAKRDVSILANGNLSMPTVKFGGTYSLKAGRDLTVGIGGDLAVSGSAIAGRDLTFTIGGKIDLKNIAAGRNVLVTSGEYINIDEDVTAGGNITLKAANGDITVGTGIVSTGAPYLGQTQAGQISLQASGDITTPLVSTALGSVQATGHSLRINDIAALGSVNLQAGGLIQVDNTSRSGGDQQWHAEESIGFGRLLTQGQALLDSLLDTRGGTLQADKGAVLDAGWRNGVASNASIRLDQATAPTLTLWAGNLINVADASIGQSVDLHGQELAIYGRHTGAGQLNLWVTGSGQVAAQRFDANLDARDIVVPHFYAVNSKLVTSAPRIDLQDLAYIDLMDLQTAQAHVVTDNLTPQFQRDADVQLYELDKAFALKQEAVTSTTNAYVVHRRDTHQVLIPNFSVQHAPVVTGIMVQGVSAARYGEQQASGRAFGGIIKQLLQSSTVLPTQGQWTPPQWGNAPADVHINLNLDKASSSDSNGAKTWDL